MFVTINEKVYNQSDIYCIYKDGLSIIYLFAAGMEMVEEFNDESELNEKYDSFITG